MFPLLSSRFTVCAMDRRGRGASGDSPDYSLKKEAEDVAAVVESRPGTVFVLGHSYGGVAALEAAFLTDRISKLILYEPPLQDPIDRAVINKIERMIESGEREQAVVTFLREVAKQSPSEVAAMRSRPSWPGLVATIDSHPRQMRVLAAYRFDAKRLSAVGMPTLLLTGSDTASPHVKQAISSLQASLPNRTLVVLEGQQHNAMDSAREQLAQAVTNFLLATATTDGADHSQDEAEIRNLQSRQQEAWNRHDAKAYANLFAEDADVVNVLGWWWKGRSEIESKLAAAYTFVFRDSTLTVTEVHVRFLTPHVAVAHVRWSMVGAKTPPGIPEPRQGIQTQVLQKLAGKWLIAAFQNTNGIPEVPFPTAPPVAQPAPTSLVPIQSLPTLQLCGKGWNGTSLILA